MDTINQVLTFVTDTLGKLYGLPGAVLCLIASIGLGWVLKGFKRFPNDAIPVVVVLAACVLNMVLADPRADTLPLRLWAAKNFTVGLIIGVVAWQLHHRWLRKIEDKIPFLKGWLSSGDTNFIKKPEDSEAGD